jgi:hypothetical protein
MPAAAAADLVMNSRRVSLFGYTGSWDGRHNILAGSVFGRRSSTPLVPLAFATLVAVACAGEGEAESPKSQGSPIPTGASPSPVADEGVEAPTEVACVNGWIEPTDPEQRELPYHVIRRTMLVDGEFHTVEMRYFEGPESPPTDKGYAQVIDRWYVKAYLESDPSFRARWLIEERFFGSAVVAVAPFRTNGFESPDWLGFQYQGPHAERQTYEGIPGRWAGSSYDFVTGEGVFNFPGLPPEVAGCLEGT